MTSYRLLPLAAALLIAPPTVAAADQLQCYEVRTYLVEDAEGEMVLDRYLADALIPALQRLGIGPVGALATAAADENPERRVVVVIPLKNPLQLLEVDRKLAADEDYAAAAKPLQDRSGDQPAYRRVVSELAIAMESMPSLQVPDGTVENPDRVYELRTYESANERLGRRKVEMFNDGEVEIFLDCGIEPIFLARTLVGPQMPSLTYLTVYPDDQARLKAWETFRAHPDWRVMSADPKYAGTVSRIDKYILEPKPYSQM